jgi:hypothetical protein
LAHFFGVFLTDVFFPAELAYADSVGYVILQYFELLVYKEKAPILQKYMALLGFYKLKHSQIPPEVKGKQEALAAYCKRLNEEMDFKNLIQMELTPQDLDENEDMRAYYKAALNTVKDSGLPVEADE